MMNGAVDGHQVPRTLRVAIAGLGVASTQVLPAMEQMSTMRIVAAADPRPDARSLFEQRYNARAYESVQALCQDADVEAVWVSTPNQFHCEHVVTAAENGKHAVVEKPMGLSIEQCERMVEAADRNNVKLLCGHTQSFNPAVRAMREVIASGELGPVRALSTMMYSDWMLRPRMAQELDLQLGGGVVYRQGPHQMDILRLLGGGLVRSVRATTGQWMASRPAPGYYAAHLTFEDGTPATAIYNGYGYFDTNEITWEQGERHYSQEERHAVREALSGDRMDDEAAKESMRFGGRAEGGYAHGAPTSRSNRPPRTANLFGLTIATCERGDIRQSPHGLYVYDTNGQHEVPVEGVGASRNSELRELYEAVIENRPVEHDGHWGMATLEVCLAIMQSSRENREITLTHQCPVRPLHLA